MVVVTPYLPGSVFFRPLLRAGLVFFDHFFVAKCKVCICEENGLLSLWGGCFFQNWRRALNFGSNSQWLHHRCWTSILEKDQKLAKIGQIWPWIESCSKRTLPRIGGHHCNLPPCSQSELIPTERRSLSVLLLPAFQKVIFYSRSSPQVVFSDITWSRALGDDWPSQHYKIRPTVVGWRH